MGLGNASRLLEATSPPHGAAGRRRVAFAVHALLAGAAVAAMILGLVPSHAPHLALLVALVAAGILAEAREVQLVNGMRIDASLAVAFVALVSWGPLAAFLVLLVSIAGGAVIAGVFASGTVRARLRAVGRDASRTGNLASLGSAGWSLLAGGAVLAGAARPSAAGGFAAGIAFAALVLAAGVVANLVQLLLGPVARWALRYGSPAGATLATAWRAALVEGALVLLSASTAVLAGYAGALALLLLAPAVLLPLLVRDPARARPASELGHAAATHLYADALADALELPRSVRRSIPNVIGEVHALRASGLLAEIERSDVLDACTLKLVTRSDACLHAAWTVNEHWDGTGPAGIGGERLPLLARIVAVAEEWSRWTAAGGPELSHQAALSEMHALSGRVLDPLVLASARRVVERERRVTREVACQPRLHSRYARLRLYLPYAVTLAR
ncbi:MAG: HD domain-containing phosphohydrolase [Solirubrobacteraceae bacterium]